MKNRSPRPRRSALSDAAAVYLALLFLWAVLRAATGDQVGFVALATQLAPWLFAPLPLALIAAAVARSRALIVAALVAAAMFVAHWGKLFLPARAEPAPAPAASPEPRPALRVMTYNVLGYATDPAPMMQAVRAEGADVVLFQELNPAQAGAITRELYGEYPYQALDPRPGVTGMGVISRSSIRAREAPRWSGWVGLSVFSLSLRDREVTLINFHMPAGGFGAESPVQRAREEQARALAAFAREAAQGGPVIVAGDANTTDLTEAYRALREGLDDAWREAGFGLGGTFPGSDIPGSSRPRIGPLLSPRWLVRIDYILYSRDLAAIEARTAQSEGGSDHRGVIATLVAR